MVNFREFLVDDSNEYIEEDEKCGKLECHPVKVGKTTSMLDTVMLNQVPAFTCGRSDKHGDTEIESLEIKVLVIDHFSLVDVAKQLHSSNCVGENYKHKECCYD